MIRSEDLCSLKIYPVYWKAKSPLSIEKGTNFLGIELLVETVIDMHQPPERMPDCAVKFNLALWGPWRISSSEEDDSWLSKMSPFTIPRGCGSVHSRKRNHGFYTTCRTYTQCGIKNICKYISFVTADSNWLTNDIM